MKLKAELYHRFPLSTILIYNGATILHFLIGSIIFLHSAFFLGKFAPNLALFYFLFSILEMYIVMPIQVCRNCVYFRLENGLCVSGLNLLTREFTSNGNPSNFHKRAVGLFCPNNLYIFSLVFPIICGIPILIFNFSYTLLSLEIFLFILLITRFIYIIPRLACVHCLAKFTCPQAGQMGVREK